MVILGNYEWACDCCLHQLSNFSATCVYHDKEQANFQWDDIISDKTTIVYFYFEP
jgi:hypothetical protein